MAAFLHQLRPPVAPLFTAMELATAIAVMAELDGAPTLLSTAVSEEQGEMIAGVDHHDASAPRN
jgi:hypothetical protein